VKAFSILVILNLFLWQNAYSQGITDTINIKPVEVVEQKIPKAYKTTQFDSSVINESTNLSEILQEHSPVFVKLMAQVLWLRYLFVEQELRTPLFYGMMLV